MNDLSGLEYADWLRFAQQEPIGLDRQDYNFGLIASTIANVNRDAKKTKPFTPADFMPFRQQEAEQPTTDLTDKIKNAFSRIQQQ